MTVWWQTAGLLREAGGHLAGVQEELISPGLLHPVLTLARRPEVWAGGLRDAFIGYFEHMDWFVRHAVAPRVESVVVWLERRARELEEYERALAAGSTWLVEPGPPAPLGDPGPGKPGPYVAPSGPVAGFTGCDPALVHQLGSQCINAGAGAGALSARINSALSAVQGLTPPDVLEASGAIGLFDLSVSLLDAARDLHRRAEAVEVGNALCGLFGTGLAIPLPGVDFVVAGSAAPPQAAPMAEGKADAERLGQAVTDARNGSCEGLETLAGDMAAKAADDPAYAADLVTTLGLDGIDDLFDAPYDSSAGGCAAPLFYTAGLIPELLGAATWSDRLSDATLDVLLSPDNERLAALLSPTLVLAPRAKDRIFDLVVEHPDHPAREQLLRVIGADPDLSQRYAMLASLGVHAPLFETTEAWTALIAAMAATTDQERNYAEAALETTIRRVAQGQELTDEARRGMALAISSQVNSLAESIMQHPETPVRPPGHPGPPGEEPLREFIHVSQGELGVTMTELMKDEQARRTLELSAGSLAAEHANAIADRYLTEIAAGAATPHSKASDDLGQQGREVGRFLCATVEAIGGRAQADAKQAVEALAGMRLGIDMAFEATKFAGKAVAGGPLAGKGAEWVANQVRKPFDGHVQSLEDERWASARSDTDIAHSMADRVIRDSTASALLHRALSAPPDQRDLFLDALAVQARVDDDTVLTGTAALRHVGLLDADGHFSLPQLGTVEYTQYETWAFRDAKGFASRVGTLCEPARDEFSDCVVRHLDVEAKGKK